MVQKTNISYADLSSNPIKAINIQNGKRFHFCTKIQAGCANCYSETMNLRLGNGLEYTKQNEQFVNFEVDQKELDALKKIRKPSRIFLFDMTDAFHYWIEDEQLHRVFDVVDTLPQHTFLVLTKRPDRMANYSLTRYGETPVPFWPGTSVSNQRDADNNIPHLLRMKANVRFLSCEPLLNYVELNQLNDIGWVVTGGESGKNRRKMDIQHMEFIQWQCKITETPFFCKQDSAFRPGQQGDIPDWLWKIKQFPNE